MQHQSLHYRHTYKEEELARNAQRVNERQNLTTVREEKKKQINSPKNETNER